MNKRTIRRTLSGFSVVVVLVSQFSVAAAALTPQLDEAIDKGMGYLQSQQQLNGSILGYDDAATDWTAIAVVANGQDPNAVKLDHGQSLVDYMASYVPTAATSATTIERKILAITAVGGDSSSFAGVDYNQLLTQTYNNGQIGVEKYLNDDIFGIMAIAAAKDESLQHIAQDALNILLSNQYPNGGFGWTTISLCGTYCATDSSITAAAIVALDVAERTGLVHPSLTNSKQSAASYLLSLQQSDGGFSADEYSSSDGNSTAWALIALNDLGKDFAVSADNARTWLIEKNQNPDGGFSNGLWSTDSETFTTPDALIALLGTDWLLGFGHLLPAPIIASQAAPSKTVEGTSQNQSGPAASAAPASVAASFPLLATEPGPNGFQTSAVGSGDQIVITSRPDVKAVQTTNPENDAQQAVVVPPKQNFIGYGLIAVALTGILAYFLKSRGQIAHS